MFKQYFSKIAITVLCIFLAACGGGGGGSGSEQRFQESNFAGKSVYIVEDSDDATYELMIFNADGTGWISEAVPFGEPEPEASFTWSVDSEGRLRIRGEGGTTIVVTLVRDDKANRYYRVKAEALGESATLGIFYDQSTGLLQAQRFVAGNQESSGGSSNSGGTPSSGGGSYIPQPNEGNNGGNTPSVPTSPTTSQVIDYYGDSTIWGWKSSSDGERVAMPAPEAFAAALSLSAGYIVRNQGVSWQTACDLLTGANGFEDWSARMRNSAGTTVVILNHGAMDAGSTNGVSVDQYRSCLTDLARIAEAAGKRVIFETPNPSAAPGLLNYVQAMQDVAAQEGLSVIDQFAYLLQRYGQDTNVIAPDGLHPTEAIYIEKGQYAAEVFLGLD